MVTAVLVFFISVTLAFFSQLPRSYCQCGYYYFMWGWLKKKWIKSCRYYSGYVFSPQTLLLTYVRCTYLHYFYTFVYNIIYHISKIHVNSYSRYLNGRIRALRLQGDQYENDSPPSIIKYYTYNITAYVAQFSDCNNRNNDSKYISNDKWNKSRTKCTSSQCTILWTFFLVVAVNKFEY